MLETLLEWDRAALIFLNGFHPSWLDPIVLKLTKTIAWLPLYLVLLYLIVKQYKNDFWRVLLAITVLLVITDQVTSEFMKPFFERLRPSREPSLAGIVKLVNGYKGGLYGFASSHAANSFGIAFFSWYLLRPQYRLIWLLFVWATLLSYTRIYLGVHYPGDIIVGAGVGWIGAWVTYKAYQRFLDPLRPMNTGAAVI
jgi:undecaprenyl-diphosphatase